MSLFLVYCWRVLITPYGLTNTLQKSRILNVKRLSHYNYIDYQNYISEWTLGPIMKWTIFIKNLKNAVIKQQQF